MKIKIRHLVIFLMVVFWGHGAGPDLVQGSGSAMDKGKKVVINARNMGEKMDVPEKEILFPDGVLFNEQIWGKTHIKKAIDELKYCFDGPENTYVLTDIPAPWITLALIEALEPLEVHYLYPREGGVELEMCELKKGEQAPNYDVVFEIKEKGDKLFINLDSDRPEAEELVQHTFDLENLCKIVIPEIPNGKHVFIHGKGMFCVLVCIAKNYIEESRSVSLAAHDSDYICAFSHTEELEAGDVTPRTIPNNL